MFDKIAQQTQKLMLLYKQASLLKGKDKQLDELLRMCDTEEQWNLIYRLLSKFNYIQYPQYGTLLKSMANHIESIVKDKESGYCLLAVSKGTEADSSQALLQHLKVPLWKSFEKGLDTCNSFGRLHKYIKEHPDVSYILVDEFCGSGRTLAIRVQDLIKEGVEAKICMLAGMEDAIQKIRDIGCDIHCCFEMPKGISGDDEMSDDEIEDAIKNMLALEGKLATQINETQLCDHSLGYGKAESLFAIQGANPPNNNFPIFWWKRYADDKERKTLLNRVQRGY